MQTSALKDNQQVKFQMMDFCGEYCRLTEMLLAFLEEPKATRIYTMIRDHTPWIQSQVGRL